jgi:hypothetical protein
MIAVVGAKPEVAERFAHWVGESIPLAFWFADETLDDLRKVVQQSTVVLVDSAALTPDIEPVLEKYAQAVMVGAVTFESLKRFAAFWAMLDDVQAVPWLRGGQ